MTTPGIESDYIFTDLTCSTPHTKLATLIRLYVRPFKRSLDRLIIQQLPAVRNKRAGETSCKKLSNVQDLIHSRSSWANFNHGLVVRPQGCQGCQKIQKNIL